MSDNHYVIWGKFFNQRSRVLWDRFPGVYRAFVVETNDPLNMYRIRIKCPELHDFNMAIEDCPWAVPAHDLGGYSCGRFSHPCIGDYVWITFEKQHPYSPVWLGFATPTRRKTYALPSIFNRTPVSVNAAGKPNLNDIKPKKRDYDSRYIPKDGRPMMHGWQDRYGHIDIHSAIGYYPTSHDTFPAPADFDPIRNSRFSIRKDKPAINEPDKKYMARVTKYGNMLIMGDQGYYWYNQTPIPDIGEFSGDPAKDFNFERKRWLYVQRLLNEDKPFTMQNDQPAENGDQRRIAMLTRYGHRFECRDVGWAQAGPLRSYTRSGEYGKKTTISSEKVNDFRWMKLRTKAGMLIQACDKGFDPNRDAFVRKKSVLEQGHRSEREDKYWGQNEKPNPNWNGKEESLYGIIASIDEAKQRVISATGADNPKDVLDEASDFLYVTIDKINDELAGTKSGPIDFKGILEGIKGILDGANKSISDKTDDNIDNIVKSVSDMLDNAVKAIVDAINQIQAIAREKDARWLRLITRYGLKIVLDDRGSDRVRAQKSARRRANGILIKGRRAPAAKKRKAHKDKRGFYFEFNENDEANHLSIGTPMGMAFEMNDRYQYTMISATMGKKWTPKHKGIKENEFIRKPLMMNDPERNSHHLKLDHDNEYIRLKSRAGKGPKPESAANKTGLNKDALNQGLEIHDGKKGDGPWVELVDAEHRGLWFSKKHQLSILRAKKKRKMYMFMEESKKRVVIYNNEKSGEIVIYARGNVRVKTEADLMVDAGRSMLFRARRIIAFQTDDAAMTLSNGLYTSGVVNADRVNAILTNAKPGDGAGASAAGGLRFNFQARPVLPKVLGPRDRAKTYNEPFEECPVEEVEHYAYEPDN